MKALEVSIDGKLIGIFVPPAGKPFTAGLGNIPGTYMRAQIMSGNETEDWQWQLPDVNEGQTISFRMIEAELGAGIPPQFVWQRDPEEIAETERLAGEAFSQAMKEREEANSSHRDG